MSDEVGIQVLIAEYTGAFIYWMLKLFKGKLSSQLQESNRKKNLWTGYIFHLIVYATLLVLFFKD